MVGNGMPQIEDPNDANKQKGARIRSPTFTVYSKNRRFTRNPPD